MNQEQFQKRVLELWARTQVPLTRATLLTLTGAAPKKAEAWLSQMASAELVDFDSDDDGELTWRVRGMSRAAGGPRTVDEVLRMEALSREVSPSRALVRSRDLLPERAPAGAGRKSVVASTALSLVLGPVGLIYAAPLKISLPATVAWLLAWGLLPTFIMAWVAGLVLPASAAVGAYFALDHNAAVAEAEDQGRPGR